jgi:signal transduction histidine kinase
VKEDVDYVLVQITDTDIGISQEELPKVFDKFYRAINAKITTHWNEKIIF